MIRRVFLVGGICLLSQACTKVDDYMLGKDNTPKPKVLQPVKEKVHLKKKWSVPVGTATKSAHHLKLRPEIKEGVIYTADVSGLVQAIDKKSAKPLWSTHLEQGIVSGPTVRYGLVALGTNESTIVALDKKTGKEQWSANLSGDALSKVAIAKDKVIVKTINGHLYALNSKNGHKEWVNDHGSPSLILKASSAPVVLDGVVLAGYPDGKLDAVDLQTGALLWQRGIAYANGSSDVERLVDIDADPIVKHGIAYLATYQGYVGAFSLQTGQFIWRKPASTYKNIAVGQKNLYLADSDDVIWAYDLSNGHVRWKQTALKARSLTAPVLMGDRILIGDKTGLLHVLSTQDGEFLSRKKLAGAIDNAPTVSGNEVYVLTGNGHLNELAVS